MVSVSQRGLDLGLIGHIREPHSLPRQDTKVLPFYFYFIRPQVGNHLVYAFLLLSEIQPHVLRQLTKILPPDIPPTYPLLCCPHLLRGSRESSVLFCLGWVPSMPTAQGPSRLPLPHHPGPFSLILDGPLRSWCS